MTAEAAVFNKQAVALAADSLVTLASANVAKKTYSVNKLFALSKHHPVGFMTYGNGTPNGISWEALVKHCRSLLGDRSFGTISEYHAWFTAELTRMLASASLDEQSRQVHQVALQHFSAIQNKIAKAVEKATASGSADVKTIATDVISKERIRLAESETLYPNCDDGRCISSGFTDAIGKAIVSILSHLPLSDESYRDLYRIVGYLFCREAAGPVSQEAGFVIAGFGQDEIFPAVSHANILGVFRGQLFSQEAEICGHHYDKSDAGIIPFAQSDVMQAFISGIDPDFSSHIVNSILPHYGKHVAQLAVAEVVNSAGLDDAIGTKVMESLTPKVQRALAAFRNKMEEIKEREYVRPLIESLQFMPKEELASIAAALVNLTSMKRNLGTDLATVGGETDVAIISKGDGFIWIDRKHYFEPRLNPHFFTNYLSR